MWFCALSADSSVVTPLLDNVSPGMASVRIAPDAHGKKPLVSIMLEDHESANHLEDGSLSSSLFSLRTAHLQDIVVISYAYMTLWIQFSAVLSGNHHNLVTL